MTSGTAVSQGREAIRLLADEGIRVGGLVKIKTSRGLGRRKNSWKPPSVPNISSCPEFNVIGWMAREIKSTIPRPERVIAGPRVCGGMTMPPEIIVEEIKKAIWCPIRGIGRTRGVNLERASRPDENNCLLARLRRPTREDGVG